VVVTQLVAGGAASERVVELNLDAPMGSRIGATIVSTGSIGAIARDPSGNVWVLDRTTGRAGARVFNPLGMEVTTAPLSSGTYPPAGIAFVP
jgi:streptogramin lyase